MSYKQERVIVIVSEFVNDKREYYPITDVPVEKARFFYKDDDGLFKVMSSSDYAVRTETNETRLYITSEKIKSESSKFQMGYEINFSASEYETSLPVLSVLVEMYNTLVEDSKTIFNYVKKQCFISDDKTTGLILPNLPPYTVWCMGENNEMFALPVSDLYEKFDQMINNLHSEIKKLLLVDKGDMSAELRNETTKLLEELNKLKVTLSTNITDLSNEEQEKIVAEGKKQTELVIAAGEGLMSRVENLETENSTNKQNIATNKQGITDLTNNKLNKGSLPATVPDADTILKLYEKAAGQKIDRDLLYLNDVGTKKEGFLYFDKVTNGLFECIKQTDSIVNSTDYFVEYSVKSNHDRLANLITVVTYTGNGNPTQEIDLGAVYKYVSISQILTSDHVTNGGYIINSADCGLLAQNETAYVYYEDKARKATLKGKILTVYNETKNITTSGLNSIKNKYKVICYFKINN